eukprot:119926-Amphidinium_carterae.2
MFGVLGKSGVELDFVAKHLFVVFAVICLVVVPESLMQHHFGKLGASRSWKGGRKGNVFFGNNYALSRFTFSAKEHLLGPESGTLFTMSRT